jgi:hypothetical protein
LDGFCYVPQAKLGQEPFNLFVGDSVFAKVSAINFYGESDFSEVGNNGVHRDVPDAPFNLQNNEGGTDATRISFSWQPGSSNGGTPVIDYRIYWATESADFVELVSGVTFTQYTTTVSVASGQNYRFKVQARNNVGYSELSEEIIIRAAEAPTNPTDVTTTVVDTNYVQIAWTAPYDGGSPILYYTVTIRESDFFTYTSTAECDGSA